MAKQIVVTINRDGTSVVDAQGFAGKGCQDATAGLELALAGNAPENRDSKRKPDFFGTHSNTSTIKR